MKNAIVLTDGLLMTSDAKTAHGLIRGTERFDIVAVVDCEATAGKDAGELLDGKNRNIPVFEKRIFWDVNFELLDYDKKASLQPIAWDYYLHNNQLPA